MDISINDESYKMEELIPIVAWLAQKYTGNASTSITYEKAQTLMEAVLYCLQEYRYTSNNSLTYKNIPVKEQYEIGLKLVHEKAEKIREIFNVLSVKFEDFGVKCLHNTVQIGIPKFLTWYDVNFCPQDTILTLDYPVLIDCTAFNGADAVYAYICAIEMEQRFLNCLDKNYVIMILERYQKQYTYMIENICEIVLSNIIGHIAIQKPLADLGFQELDYSRLSKLFKKNNISQLEGMVKDYIETMINQLYSGDVDMLEYFTRAAEKIAVGIDTLNQCGKLDKIFIV